jgi:hypothetical protein
MQKQARGKKLGLHRDAWARFERAVDVVAKSPPQHRKAKAKRKRKASRKSKKKSGGR